MSDKPTVQSGTIGMGRREFALLTICLAVVLWPAGLAGAVGRQFHSALPCGRTLLMGGAGACGPILGCVRRPTICREHAPRVRRGMTGERGAAGRTGASGADGSTGGMGPLGPGGSRGSDGTAGAQGLQGVQGSIGLTGALGLPGATGFTGAVGLAGVDGALGLTGATGEAGFAGATGAQGLQGVQGSIGATGAVGLAGAIGATGAVGAAGPQGGTGADGPRGLTGPTGPAGSTSSGLAQYAYIYNTSGEVVPLESGVTFDTHGVLTSGIVHAAGDAGITLVDAGVYKVSFSVSVTEPNQMTLFVGGVPTAGATYGSGAGTQQNSGQVIVMAAAGAVVTVRNHSSAAAIGLATPIGGTQPTANASILIEKLD
jgi:Collagen triple helix repeat (20 copies)